MKHYACIGEGNGTPLQCSCLENPRDGASWWAAVYGVAQSRTRLKWLSSMHVFICWINKMNTAFLSVSPILRAVFCPRFLCLCLCKGPHVCKLPSSHPLDSHLKVIVSVWPHLTTVFKVDLQLQPFLCFFLKTCYICNCFMSVDSLIVFSTGL